jgi:hypothetical protein
MGSSPMTEPSVEEIVATWERDYKNGFTHMPGADIRALIADWRKRGEVAKAMMKSRDYWRRLHVQLQERIEKE